MVVRGNVDDPPGNGVDTSSGMTRILQGRRVVVNRLRLNW